LHENDDVAPGTNTNSQIQETLAAGTYTGLRPLLHLHPGRVVGGDHHPGVRYRPLPVPAVRGGQGGSLPAREHRGHYLGFWGNGQLHPDRKRPGQHNHAAHSHRPLRRSVERRRRRQNRRLEPGVTPATTPSPWPSRRR
jgi:hypothetical protein